MPHRGRRWGTVCEAVAWVSTAGQFSRVRGVKAPTLHVSGLTRNPPFSRVGRHSLQRRPRRSPYTFFDLSRLSNMVRPTLRLSQSLRPRRAPQSHPRQARFASTNPSSEAAQKKAQDAFATAQKYAGDAAEAAKRFLGPAGEKAANFLGGMSMRAGHGEMILTYLSSSLCLLP